MTVMV